MWINSSLGKWDQDARVNNAFRDAERRRMVEDAQHPGDGALSGRLVNSVRSRLHWPGDLSRRVVDVVRSLVGTPSDPQGQCC
jgi:hypothetical protein